MDAEPLTAIADIALEGTPSRLLVLGMGNEILSDDGVGLVVLDMVAEKCGGRPGREVTFKKMNTGGLDLIYETEGFDQLIVVDAFFSEESVPGRVRTLGAGDLGGNGELSAVDSAHLLSLPDAMEVSRRLGYKTPELLAAVVVDVGESCLVFGEELSPIIAAAARVATGVVMKLIEEYAGDGEPARDRN